ncbi:hypothetical protein ILYODFUR_030239 [Ilyodon furcidens]|uniref:Uncharacterized protein n=1 Tax=Ilyodon furcidens TaxID=33524 RepID=A0ABV0V7E2_9TELE
MNFTVEDWDIQTQVCLTNQQIIKTNLEIAKQRFNYTEGCFQALALSPVRFLTFGLRLNHPVTFSGQTPSWQLPGSVISWPQSYANAVPPPTCSRASTSTQRSTPPSLTPRTVLDRTPQNLLQVSQDQLTLDNCSQTPHLSFPTSGSNISSCKRPKLL